MSALPSRPAVDPRRVKTLYFEDLHVGMREVLMKTVMDTDVVGFAQLSGDENPIHLCDDFAAGTRFGQRIAHGLYTASLISAVLGTRLPGPGAVYRSQTLNFHAPVKIGDVVTVVVEVVELVPEGRRVRLHCEALVDGVIVLDGEAIVSVPRRPVAPA
jgi:3-hydroxybutyryl-CoA dehydratase